MLFSFRDDYASLAPVHPALQHGCGSVGRKRADKAPDSADKSCRGLLLTLAKLCKCDVVVRICENFKKLARFWQEGVCNFGSISCRYKEYYFK
jgi:hypothetical protein